MYGSPYCGHIMGLMDSPVVGIQLYSRLTCVLAPMGTPSLLPPSRAEGQRERSGQAFLAHIKTQGVGSGEETRILCTGFASGNILGALNTTLFFSFKKGTWEGSLEDWSCNQRIRIRGAASEQQSTSTLHPRGSRHRVKGRGKELRIKSRRNENRKRSRNTNK